MNVAEVAEVYTAAVASGAYPVQAVQEKFGLPKRTATNWIARARAAGYTLTYTAPNPVSLIAADLGVDARDLAAAVRRHAPSGLRVPKENTHE